MRGWVAAMHTDVVGERMGDAKHRQRPPIGPLAVAIPLRAPLAEGAYSDIGDPQAPGKGIRRRVAQRLVPPTCGTLKCIAAALAQVSVASPTWATVSKRLARRDRSMLGHTHSIIGGVVRVASIDRRQN